MESTKHRLKPGVVMIVVLLALGAVIMVIPFVWMFLTAFKTYEETLKVPIQWVPGSLQFGNFTEVINKLNFGRYYINTIFVTVVVTCVQVFFCTTAAYAFARIEFPGRRVLFFILLTILMVPSQMTLLPAFVLLSDFGWIDTFMALTVPHFFSAYGTFFLRQFFMTLPRELEEAAVIDGANHPRIYAQVTLPLCTSAIAAFSIFTVLWAWNDLMWPLIMTSRDDVRVLSVGIATLVGQYSTRNNLLMAASVLATAPMIAIFIFCQKQFIAGIAITGMKG